MLRQFFKDSVVYGASGVVARGISFFLVPFYTRVFTPGDYGIIDLIGIISSVVGYIFSLEITQAIARYYPDADGPESARGYASTALIFTLTAFSGFLVFGIAIAEPLARGLSNEELNAGLIRAAGLSIFANWLMYFVQNQLRWRLEPKSYAICSILYSLMAIGLTVALVLGFRVGVIGVFLAQAIAGLTTFILGMYFSRSSYRFTFEWKKFKEMVSFSLPLVPSSLGMFMLGYADRIAITSMMSIGDLGIFGIGFRVASIVTLIMGGFQTAITPLVYSKYKESDTPSQLASIFRYFTFAALIATAGLTLFSREILVLLTTPSYYAAESVIPPLVASSFLSNMYVFAPGLSIAKKTKHIAVINLSGAVLNVGLNYFLVGIWGIVGAACSTLISSCFIFGAFMKLSQRYYSVPHNPGLLLKSIALTVIVSGMGYALDFQSLFVAVAAKSTLLGLLFFFLMVIGLMRLDEFRLYFGKLRLNMQ